MTWRAIFTFFAQISGLSHGTRAARMPRADRLNFLARKFNGFLCYSVWSEKDHDLFVAQRHEGIYSSRAKRGQQASENCYSDQQCCHRNKGSWIGRLYIK